MSLDLPAALSRKAPPRNPMGWLRYGMLTLLAVLTAAVLYMLAERARTPADPPLSSLETGEGVAQHARSLDVTRTRRGLPSLRVSAAEALTYRDGHTELHDVAVTVYDDSRGAIEISAPLAVSRERSSGGWSFQDGVLLREENGIRVRVPEITYRSKPPELEADGEVRFTKGTLEGQARGLRYLVPRRRLEFLSQVEITFSMEGDGLRHLSADSATLDPRSQVIRFDRYATQGESGDRLTGTSLSLILEENGDSARVRSLISERGFRAEIPASSADGDETPHRILTGERLDMNLGGDGQLRSAVAEGGVRLSDGDPNNNPRSLSCELLEAEFVHGRITGLTASRSAHLHVPAEDAPSGETATISAERISASFRGEEGRLTEVRADEDVTASHGDHTLEAPHLVYTVDAQIWSLQGEEGAPAMLTTSEASVRASSIDLDRPSEVMTARGQVKTLYRDPQRQAGESPQAPRRMDATGFEGLFGSGEGALHAMADHLRLNMKERKARYSGSVRVWRGAGSIEAETLDYSEAEAVMEATEGVVARIPIDGNEDASTGTATITSGTLRYDSREMDALFGGGVAATASGMRIQSESMHAKGATLHGLTQLEAAGQVTLRQGSVAGEGDRLEADFEKDTFTLYGEGRLASIQDQSSQQLVRGAVLTYERSTGTIQVESESGGRTWITLRPKSERGEGGDPQSPR